MSENSPIPLRSSGGRRENIPSDVVVNIGVPDAPLVGGSPGKSGTSCDGKAQEASGQHRTSHPAESSMSTLPR